MKSVAEDAKTLGFADDIKHVFPVVFSTDATNITVKGSKGTTTSTDREWMLGVKEGSTFYVDADDKPFMKLTFNGTTLKEE